MVGSPVKKKVSEKDVNIKVFVRASWALIKDFYECHDDFSLKPVDGILKDHTFTWLGFVQYIHVTTGLPHHSKAPRVTLIAKQFVLGTAIDVLRLPKNYRLGNVVFGDYERDEEDCDLTKSQIKMGLRCARAYLEMPIVKIIPHPEFSRFGVGNSLALIKLVRPMKSSVPRDFDSEKMGKKTLKLFTHRECREHRLKSRLGSEGVTHALCTSGCGVRPGAPIATHNVAGGFELMGVAAGGSACTRRSMRNRLNREPPLYIDVYPYVTWIINVVTANVLPYVYPHNFRLTDAKSGTGMAIKSGNFLRRRGRQQAGWKARTYCAGKACINALRLSKLSYFYTEKFEVNADPPARLNIIMKFSAGIDCTIQYVALGLPNRLSEPYITGVGGYNITVELNTEWFPFTFFFNLQMAGENTTISDRAVWFRERIPGFE